VSCPFWPHSPPFRISRPPPKKYNTPPNTVMRIYTSTIMFMMIAHSPTPCHNPHIFLIVSPADSYPDIFPTVSRCVPPMWKYLRDLSHTKHFMFFLTPLPPARLFSTKTPSSRFSPLMATTFWPPPSFAQFFLAPSFIQLLNFLHTLFSFSGVLDPRSRYQVRFNALNNVPPNFLKSVCSIGSNSSLNSQSG